MDGMTLRVASVIMAYVKSDQVKQSDNNLEHYRLFAEDKLKLFICREFDQCDSLPRKIMLEGDIYHWPTRTTPINSRRKKQPRGVF